MFENNRRKTYKILRDLYVNEKKNRIFEKTSSLVIYELKKKTN